ncbi:serine hydrolase domain-containing protein [Variovorax sp. PBL-E5]|uniref:serine hydrolase domain-containing protein n=1 Tax=Variovorax sp. PBL-E5 TaxID=434014 RepID=UPI001316128F|nr:serine hydrolase [Variovorax sp. PBL-E5]VTU37181.1 6-aminohexanoate-dimer hydrolase [Variovorax sp. PBL-E5]
MPRLPIAASILAAAVLTACGHFSPGRAAPVISGYLSHQLCSAVFVAGRSPDRYYRDAIEPLAGPVAFLTRFTVDREHGEVRATFAGLAESRAVYRPQFGCVNATGRASASELSPPAQSEATPPLLGAIAGAAPVQPAEPALVAALDHAFDETTQAPHRFTQAVVVIHKDRIVAERYASDVGVDTPLTGWSATKSVTNALIGILVRQGKLDIHAPAPIMAWADPRDPRHAITIDQLLRMNSGLDMGQSLTSSVLTAFDPSAQMIFVDADTAAMAQRAPLAYPPGTHWNYTNANTQLLSRIVRDQAGGTAAATLGFARRELFDKLGMQHVTLEFDAAGTPIGASHMWASARDWARFGLLYLHDGVVGGQRILPAGWVDDSAAPTSGSEDFGYGAGFWTNRGPGAGARYRIRHGMPADAFMARGSNGQYVVIIPSKDLVIVRLGPAWTPRDDMERVAQFTREVIEALKGG